MRTKRLLSCLLAAAFLLPACNLRPLEDPSEIVRVRVAVNIRAVANVTAHVYNEHIPVPSLNTEMMRVLVYDPVSKDLVAQSFISAKSVGEGGAQTFTGNLNISYGTFDLLVYNFDTPVTQVAGENNEQTLLAFTNPVPESILAKYRISKGEYDDFSINYEPDHLVVAREQNLRVSPHDSVVVIHTEARTIIDTYYLQVYVEGMQYTSQATAVISGLSSSNHFGVGKRTESPTTAVCFELNKGTDEKSGVKRDVLCAVFNTFGKVENADSDLLITFNVTDTAGQLLQFQFNLNDVFLTEDAIERHWLLIDKTIVVPKPEVDPGEGSVAGGFQPEVYDWNHEEGYIEL